MGSGEDSIEISVFVKGEEFTHFWFNLRQHYVRYCLSAPLRRTGEHRYSSRIGKYAQYGRQPQRRGGPPPYFHFFVTSTLRMAAILVKGTFTINLFLCDVNVAAGGHVGPYPISYVRLHSFSTSAFGNETLT
jgi:hypothetical protein